MTSEHGKNMHLSMDKIYIKILCLSTLEFTVIKSKLKLNFILN